MTFQDENFKKALDKGWWLFVTCSVGAFLMMVAFALPCDALPQAIKELQLKEKGFGLSA